MDIKFSFMLGFQIFVTSLVITYILIPRMCLYANKIGLLDYSNKRKAHSVGRPLVGGITIAISLTFSSFMFIESKQISCFFAGMVLIVIIGFLDDYKNLSPKLKLLGQIITAIFVIVVGEVVIQSVGTVSLGIFAIPVTIFCIVGVINSTNMIDGVDGLVGAVSTIAFISFAILSYINDQSMYLLLCIALSGCVIAFLRHNWHPSLLFLGDAGSFLIGYSMIFLSIALSQKHNSVVPSVVPLLIMAVPIADLSSVSLRRIINGKNPFTADKRHLHHLLLRLGFKKRDVVLIIALITTLLSALGIIGTIYKIHEYYLFSLFISYFVLNFAISLYIKKLLRFKVSDKKGWHHVQSDTLPMKEFHKTVKISNKRSHMRTTNHQGIICSIEADNGNMFNISELVNISFSGFAARVDQYLSDYEHGINFVVPGYENNAEWSVAAEIMWMYRFNGSYTYGFRFTKMDNGLKSIINGYL